MKAGKECNARRDKLKEMDGLNEDAKAKARDGISESV